MMKKGVPRDENGLRKAFLLEDWLVQPQLNRITRGDETVQLQPKIMAVLVCLAEAPGTVVMRETLFREVWAETYVTEHVLARSISILRKTFNDKPQNPRVIETIPKVGYRLIAAIQDPMEDPELEEAENQETAPDPKDQISHPAKAATPATTARLLSPRTLSWTVALLGLLFFTFVVMGGGHGHFHH
jgi:DNA-binding winged helix-turn-helix (wHTH) protein